MVCAAGVAGDAVVCDPWIVGAWAVATQRADRGCRSDLGRVAAVFILDGRTVGLLPSPARKPTTRESAEAQKHTYTPNWSRPLREQPDEHDDDLLSDEEAISLALLEQRRNPVYLIGHAA